MSIRHFDVVKRIAHVVVWGFLAIYIFSSIVVAQITGPYNFRGLDRDPNTAIPFLKALVEVGDMSLLKSTAQSLLGEMYESIFSDYITQDGMKQKISVLAERVTESRDLEIANAYIAIRDKDIEKAKEHFARAKEIDPLIFVPIDVATSN